LKLWDIAGLLANDYSTPTVALILVVQVYSSEQVV